MKIVKGNEEHIDACLSIARELSQYFNEKGIAQMGRDLRKHMIYLAKDSNEIVGFAAVNRKSKNVAEISWMAIKLQCQRKGAGSALIDFVVNELRLRGIKLLEAKTLAENVEHPPYEITRNFYEKMGFFHLKTVLNPEWGPENPCAIYVKMLIQKIIKKGREVCMGNGDLYAM